MLQDFGPSLACMHRCPDVTLVVLFVLGLQMAFGIAAAPANPQLPVLPCGACSLTGEDDDTVGGCSRQ